MAGTGPARLEPREAVADCRSWVGPALHHRAGACLEAIDCTGLRLRPLVDAGQLFLLRHHRFACSPPHRGHCRPYLLRHCTGFSAARRITSDRRGRQRLVLAHDGTGVDCLVWRACVRAVNLSCISMPKKKRRAPYTPISDCLSATGATIARREESRGTPDRFRGSAPSSIGSLPLVPG